MGKNKQSKGFKKLKQRQIAKELSGVRLKCSLCGKLVHEHDLKFHLKIMHGKHKVENPRAFFLTKTEVLKARSERIHNQIQKATTRSHLAPDNIPCGTVINGAPPVKIIYNPVATNRKRH